MLPEAPLDAPLEAPRDALPVAAEQRHLDDVRRNLDRMIAELRGTRSLAADEATEERLALLRRERLTAYTSASGPVLFGRIDVAGDEPRYVGRHAVFTERQQVQVVNWRAPAAARFYTATHEDSQGVALRRRIGIEDWQVVAVVDEWLDGSTPPVDVAEQAAIAAATLERSGRMRHIVSTIRPDQHALISTDAGGALVIQGGPGTGKTAVALHRAAWLLYNDPALARQGMLIVGPNPAFMRYVGDVLPSLGERSVEQRAVDRVAPLRVARRDAPATAALKGDVRLAEVLRSAVHAHVRVPARDLELTLERRRFTVPKGVLARCVELARSRDWSYARGREQLRAELNATVAAELAAHVAPGSHDALDEAVRRSPELQREMQRLWPSLTATRVLARLLSGRRVLARAADGVLDAGEQELLLRDARDRWTVEDGPLLDELEALIGGVERVYGHVVVDEAQDVSPMALRMLARRAAGGSMTLVGDVAQADRELGPRGWAALLEAADLRARVEDLTVSYRVPRDFIALAAGLLAELAPGMRPPRGVHPPDAPLAVVDAGAGGLAQVAERVVAEARERSGTVALIAPADRADELAQGIAELGAARGLAEDAGVSVLTAREAKGLEFDHVVVAEPEAIRAEPRGASRLYVALTRATRTLGLVHERPLPSVLQIRSE